MPINNRGIAGQPVLPYVDFRSYAGADVFIDLTFLDHTGTPQTPNSIVYELDDMSNVVNMIPSTSLAPTGSAQTLQIPGSLMVMTRQWHGSQICQFSMQAVLPDNSTIQGVTIIELCAIQTPFSAN